MTEWSQIVVFWVVTPYSLVGGSSWLKWGCFTREIWARGNSRTVSSPCTLQPWKWRQYVLWNVGTHLPDYTGSQSRRSQLQLWKLKTFNWIICLREKLAACSAVRKVLCFDLLVIWSDHPSSEHHMRQNNKQVSSYSWGTPCSILCGFDTS
jgi:hypothetical protein